MEAIHDFHHDLFGQPIRWAGVDRGTLLTKLNKLGWITDRHLVATTDDEVRLAIMSYQSFHGLARRDGYLDAETIRSINSLRFCSRPDIMPAMSTNLGRWGKKQIKWNMQVSNWPIIGTQAALNAFSQAWAYWAAVCGIEPSYTTDPNQADVVTTIGKIDGPFNVLAYSQIPGPNNMQRLSQEFDQDESYAVGMNVPANTIDLVRVAAHECGHALGLPHLPGTALLAPIYSPSVYKPLAPDIKEVVARYGASTAVAPGAPPVAQPSNPSTPVPNGLEVIGLEISGIVTRVSIPGWTVTKNP